MHGGLKALADIPIPQSAARMPAEVEALLAKIFVEIELLQRQMQQDRAEIDHLKATSARLEAETLSILSRLKAIVW